MLEELNIDVLGVSIDSLMIIINPEIKDDMIKLLQENNIKTDIIGKVTDTGHTYIEYDDGCEKLVPKFREAAYTPIKKVVDELYDTSFEENKVIIDNATKSAIDKKNKIVKKIMEKNEQ